jgi:hypothetical protein
MNIYEYIGDNPNIQYGTPFCVIRFFKKRYFLMKTSWDELKNNPEGITEKSPTNSLLVEQDTFKKSFRFSKEI